MHLGKERRVRLEDSLKLYKFFGDMEEEEMFVKETENVLASKEVGKDLISLTRLQQKHKVSNVPDNSYFIMGSIGLGSFPILLT